jgi:probable O-glycosylation ligase (exosortase A-associated)
MLIALGWLAFIKPWLGVLGLVVVALLHPQGYSRGFMQTFPAYLTLFVAVSLSTLWHYVSQREWPRLVWDWRIAVFAMLWAWFVVTTSFSINHWVAWPKLWEIAKLLPPLLLILVLIDTREKLDALLVTVGLCIAVVVLKGGYWAVITGFQDRVYGPPGSPYAGNNEFAVATAMTLPLLSLWYKRVRINSLRWALAILIALGFASALSSWSRGGLLSLGAVALLLLWHSRYKLIALPLAVMSVVLAFYTLPEKWFARMDTIASYRTEASALSRIEAWQLGLNFVREHPWLGGGFEGWVFLTLPMGGSMDWHSAYVEMATEHGVVGLGLWSLLVFGSTASLTWLLWMGRRSRDSWLTDHSAMLRASLIAYAVGAAFLGIAYWELLYLLVVGAIIVGRFSRNGLRA